ncbi:MAG: acylphosphatase [Afipia sp.]|nr:acylphosphatase [Afipia sp.]
MARLVQRLSIRGRVQGVGFRYWTRRAAKDFGVEGWVRNRRDGSVEVLAAGPARAVAALTEACKRGPPSAQVATLNVEQASDSELNLRRHGESFSEIPSI